MAVKAVALDVTVGRMGGHGPHVYVTELAQALAPILGERLRPIASRWATPADPHRTVADRLRTLGRDLWWHQVGVQIAARRAGAALLHLPATTGPVRSTLATILTIHDLAVLRFPQWFRSWFRAYSRIVLPRAARSADAIITVSEASKADIVEGLGIPSDRVVVIPNGIRSRFTAAPPSSDVLSAARRRWDLPEAFVLAVGAIEPRKNLARLIEAIQRLRGRPETRDIVLVHAGPPGWLTDGVRESAAVRFLGYVPLEDLADLYRLARVFAYPSLYEGFGLPVIEAMACGCPVVTSSISSLPEVAGGAALLVAPEAVEDIATAIGNLWTNAAGRAQLVAKGLERARPFTWERAAARTAALYDAVQRR